MNACKLTTIYAPLTGRALLAFLFPQSGWDKAFNFQKVVGTTKSAAPTPRQRHDG